MTDIVERLRAWTTDWDGSQMVDGEPPRDGLHCDILREAATEIERLRAERKAECERRDEIIASETHLRKEAQDENTRLRAALAQSKSPCVYCSLPAEEWAKCKDGFPGCARADDAMGCPELGASLQLEELRAERDAAWLAGWEAAKEKAAEIVSSLFLDRAETAEAIKAMEKPQ